MTSEELEEYAKLMEERAKEAKEFFKSESENKEDEIFGDSKGVLHTHTEATEQNNLKLSEESMHLPNEIANEEISDDITKEDDLSRIQLTKKNSSEILADDENKPNILEEQERPKSSKVLITEIIELPKIDMNTVLLNQVKNHTPSPTVRIKEFLTEKHLSGSPSLSGDPNKLIDLETGDLIDKKSSGMDHLVRRLMSSVKAKKLKKSETCSLLSLENGKIEMSKVNISLTDNKDVLKDSKPGAAYFELKRNLEEIIKKKRLEEINKKQEDEVEFIKCLEDEDDDDYNEEEEDESADKTKNKSSKNLDVLMDEDENTVLVEDVCNEEDDYNDVLELSNVDEDVKSNDDNEDVEDNIDNSGDNEENSERKSRIIKAFVDTDEEGDNDDIDFLKTQPASAFSRFYDTQSSIKKSLEEEENELLALCSGTFDKTQRTSVNALMSQIPLTQYGSKPINEQDLMELCSGSFGRPTEIAHPTQPNGVKDNIISSDEENDELNRSKEKIQRVKKLKKRLMKKRAKLGFSDDEEESAYEEDSIGDVEPDDDVKLSAAAQETFVDYDSEENEIIVKMSEEDKVKRVENFFEYEAELSESEWGSADEDENNLDKYDVELGDEDEFDKEKLRTELGQIHARKMLDEDIREVRKIQELLFEDEERDGVGRQRTFKWKNAESGFSLDDVRPLDETVENQNGDSGDEINEHHWRKLRYEREQFLKERGIKSDSENMSTELCNNPTEVNMGTNTTVIAQKFQIIKSKKPVLSSVDFNKGSPFLISSGISAMHKKSVRGSFLVRDKETLEKLAGLTKGTSSSSRVTDADITSGTISFNNSKTKNFVFATLTEEEHENRKRKSEDLSISANVGKNFIKKSKIEPRRDKCVIDHLL